MLCLLRFSAFLLLCALLPPLPTSLKDFSFLITPPTHPHPHPCMSDRTHVEPLIGGSHSASNRNGAHDEHSSGGDSKHTAEQSGTLMHAVAVVCISPTSLPLGPPFLLGLTKYQLFVLFAAWLGWVRTTHNHHHFNTNAQYTQTHAHTRRH